MNNNDSDQRYWRANLWIVSSLLVVWFLVSYGAGILWADELNRFHLGGFPLGFWFAQQGSIVGFLVLVLVYGVVMNALDRRFNQNDDENER